MATELMQFRIGEEWASRLWLEYQVGNTQVTMHTKDSQGSDDVLVINEGNLAQLRDWLANVDARMYADDDEIEGATPPSNAQDANVTARDGDRG